MLNIVHRVISLQPNAGAAAGGGGGAGGGWGDPAAQWPPAGIDATRLKAPPAAGWTDDWNSRKVVYIAVLSHALFVTNLVLLMSEFTNKATHFVSVFYLLIIVSEKPLGYTPIL